ncbi:DnaJ-domain-containing protein [Guyanagaster necrorhizus]|uniref:Diphthamide biosynthesis protein 4 n=1 Tax=Guyanagaster necrorhizus TaxID=856835 RepID=A0A9P7W4L2_9AGAR|nr:DnaJ-domain-containing protein [Guyanagaster necrorhizus MCA 3950]KAG7452052.1 DnaJ-domain-containing protein [Guyanagaster necrorhizus MCA 3950]
MQNFYQVLSISRSASLPEIKAAYRKMLLQHHPDKSTLRKEGQVHVDFTVIQEAYFILSDPVLRHSYDVEILQKRTTGGPRPAQVVSLDDFDEEQSMSDSDHSAWTYKCRCGGVYTITDKEMEVGHHSIACSSCSEVIWVGYELAGEEKGSGASLKW